MLARSYSDRLVSTNIVRYATCYPVHHSEF
jgi:hypothetical protein